MNEATWVGVALRAVMALGVLLFGTGLASRVCTGALAWSMATGFYAALFAYISLGVVPQPNEAGLVYSIQWGSGGAALYCVARALDWVGPRRSARAPDPDDET